MLEINAGEMRKAMESGAVVLDVREPSEYATGHVPGSRLVPLSKLPEMARELDPELPVFLICRTGRRSSQGCGVLEAQGFRNVRTLSGGLKAWKKEGLPLERNLKHSWSLERQVRLVAELLVLLSVALAHWVSPLLIYIAAGIGSGLAIAAITDTCAMGHSSFLESTRRSASACKG